MRQVSGAGPSRKEFNMGSAINGAAGQPARAVADAPAGGVGPA